MRAVNPNQYFAECELEESRLLRFLYQPRCRRLDLVIIYAADAVDAAFRRHEKGKGVADSDSVLTDFRHFRLEGVVQVVRDLSADGEATDWGEYERSILPRPVVLTDVEHTITSWGSRLSFTVGRFGRHRVEYAELLVETRLASAIVVGTNLWDYFDVDTGDAVDFFNPFPSVDRA